MKGHSTPTAGATRQDGRRRAADRPGARGRVLRWATRLFAGLLVLLLVFFFVLPVFAVSNNTQATLDQLAVLQSNQIQHEWLPDIAANEAAVQSLLDLYLACTAAERAEFSRTEVAELKAYFVALYEVQGRDVGAVDALFEEGAGGSSSSSRPDSGAASASSSSSQTAASSSGAGSLGAGSASLAAASSRPTVAPSVSMPQPPAGDVSADVPASTPTLSSPPDAPGDEGWLGLFGNRAFGTALIAILLGLAVILFIRFLAAMRKSRVNEADEDAGIEAGSGIDARDADGEIYAPLDRRRRGKASALGRGDEARAEAAARPEDNAGPAAAAPLPGNGKPAPAGRADADADAPAMPGMFDPPKPPPPLPSEKRAARGGLLGRLAGREVDDVLDEATAMTAADAAPAPDPEAEKNPPRDEGERPAEGAAGTEAGKGKPAGPNSISMRSFSAQPRTGRPAKMPFRQGDPDDIDAIDD